jgi:TetR/AcrR family transcriptional repressor of nem operon
MMARPREFDPNDVLRTAIELFWDKGYFDASVDELVRRSGVAKYGIYGTFGPKQELFRKVLKQYGSDRHRDIQSPIREPDASLPEIQRFFKEAVRLMTQENGSRGCLMVNTGMELGLRDPEIRNLVQHFFKETRDVMERCLCRAVEQGELEKSLDVPALATYLVTEFRTALMLARSGHSRREIQAHLDTALRLLQ